MSKRHLSEQQRRRIASIQQRRLTRASLQAELALEAQIEGESPRPGRIITRHGRNLLVENPAGHLVPCLFRQNLGHAVCGDQVLWQPTGDQQGVVVALEPRRSTLIRPDASGQEKPLAANVDRLVIVLAPEPAPQRYLLDQYLVSAVHLGIETLLCLNKADLLDRETERQFDALLGIYPRIGYPLIKVSSRPAPGLQPLLEQIAGQTAILLGQSGVGKSSLISALLPDLEIQTGRLSAATGHGCHTTSATTLYHLPQGGALIDSPGVRSFRPLARTHQELEQGFVEFAPFLGHCRFSNCRHQQEPGCALREAVADGHIDAVRLDNFLHMAAHLI